MYDVPTPSRSTPLRLRSQTRLPTYTMPVGEISSPPFFPLARLALPPRALTGLVERLAIYRIDPAVWQGFHGYRLPEPRGLLLFLRRRSAPAWTKLLIAGAHDIYEHAPFQGAESCVVAWLEPGACGWCSGKPARAMRNRIEPLTDIWGSPGEALHRRLAGLESDDAVQAAMVDALSARPRNDWTAQCRVLIDWMQQHAWDAAISDVVQRSGFPDRQLLRLFDRHVGLTPKRVLRILRVRALIATLREQADPQWGPLASRAGYTDQSHMITEVVQFTGMTPTQLSRCRTLGMILSHAMLFMPRGLDPATLDHSVIAPRRRVKRTDSAKA